MGELAIEAHGLEKSYGTRRALNGVDLEVGMGEIFGFLGPNGAGKTTAIRCFLDLIRPSAGSIRVLGFDAQKQSVEIRRRSGYLPGELRLDERRTVRKTLEFYASLRGETSRSKALSRYPDLATRLDLELDLRVGALSKGNKQKVGIIVALMHDPALLILDEPTSGLDPLIQHEVLRLVVGARDRGATVFFSSHQLSEVQEIAERVAMIRDGVVVEVAETERLMHRSFRRVVLRFGEAVERHGLAELEGVVVLTDEPHQVRLEVTGDMGALLAEMSKLPIVEFETETPTLEEIFRSYYEQDEPE